MSLPCVEIPVPYSFTTARVISLKFGAMERLKKAVIRFVIAELDRSDSFGSIVRYLFDFLVRSDMYAYKVMRDALILF